MQVLASLLLNCAEKELLIVQKIHIFMFVQKYCYQATMHSRFLVQSHFRGCAEIEIFGDIFTSGPAARECSLPNQPRDNFCFVHFVHPIFYL